MIIRFENIIILLVVVVAVVVVAVVVVAVVVDVVLVVVVLVVADEVVTVVAVVVVVDDLFLNVKNSESTTVKTRQPASAPKAKPRSTIRIDDQHRPVLGGVGCLYK